MSSTVLVLGGTGAYGAPLIGTLKRAGATCVALSNDGAARARVLGVEYRAFDPAHPDRLTPLLQDAFCFVDARDPWCPRDARLIERCAARGVHYLDIADDPTFVRSIVNEVQRLARNMRVAVVTGASLGALDRALLDTYTVGFDTLAHIDIAWSLGNAHPHARCLVQGWLALAGAPLAVKQDGRGRKLRGWSEPLAIRFPAPLGRRRVYLRDAAHADALPRHFGVQSVQVRLGSARRAFNHSLRLVAGLRNPARAELPKLARLVTPLAKAVGRGADRGTGLRLVIEGQYAGAGYRREVFLLTAQSGPAVLVAPAAALVSRWLTRGVETTGAYAAAGAVSFADIKAILASEDATLILQ